MWATARRVTAGLAAAAALFTGVQAIAKVSRGGRYLYTDDGNRFYIKGVAYQPQGDVVASSDNAFGEPSTFTDPLANDTACSRDLPYLQQLGVNTVRVYSVNSSLNHDSCMHALSGANIYVIIDLSLPLNGSFDRNAPAWTTSLLDQYITTIDAFSGYDNVLAYNVGNEVVIAANGTGTAAFIKAAARDVKAYLASKSYNALVGYAAIDGTPTWRDPLANYLSCDPSSSNSGSTALDLYGLNNYEWCGDSTYQASYAGTNGDYAGYNIPAYFSEFGCVTSGESRTFQEVSAIYSSPMTDVWSGGLAFSYFPASSSAGQFGLVTIDGNSVTPSTDFNNLKTQYGSVSPPNSPSSSSAGSTQYPSCPGQNDTFLASTTLPPTPSDAECGCMAGALSCRFTPPSSNDTATVGALLNYGCSLLGQAGLSCNDIAANGSTGTYGRASFCDPETKLSYVMSQYYESQNKNQQACSFGGNGTVHSTSASASAVASSCIANPSATFTPSAPASATGGSSTGGSGSSGSNHSGALSGFSLDSRAIFGVGLMIVVSAFGGIATLA
ncbi:glycoside hydrolase family 72 protein [Gloeophyllum trabeum ATCC 11539]|uniref:1,3-beta-glucanosyltransferase n=1 Tax=Gloeophyllum trabeum (strain ATCC 11539 / FP-39264 / Madison 617) TaxID=670483 RepID=S7QNI8_GLOTA|nr:glycoside hydrolase family 72 protein [Gloeophyllum trabeum ATCC 11539]EPQ61101.1 glycoside hydrolase family 72 protein [Gloeophyllum trabeum ATCC 11539]